MGYGTGCDIRHRAHRYADRGGGILIVCKETASREIIVDLVPYGSHRVVCGRGIGAEREYPVFLRFGHGKPGIVIGTGGVESLYHIRGDALRPAPVGRRANGRHAVRHGRGGLGVVTACRNDHSVAVQHRPLEDRYAVGRVGNADAVGILLAKVMKYLPCGIIQPLSLPAGTVDIVEPQLGLSLEYAVLVLDDGAEPPRRTDHFADPDLAVIVAVNKPEGFLVEFQIGDRAAQDGPVLLVEFSEPLEVAPVVDLHSDGSSEGAVIPRGNRSFHKYSRIDL